MTIFRLTGLAEQLRDGVLSERQKLNYLFLLFALGLLIGSPGAFSFVRDERTFLYFIAILVIYVVGLVACFDANRAGDDRAFVERITVLGAAVSLRLYVVVYACWYVLVGVITAVGADSAWPADQRQLAYFLVHLGGEIAAFVWLRNAIKIAASGQGANLAAAAETAV